jgi:hypothetical protein
MVGRQPHLWQFVGILGLIYVLMWLACYREGTLDLLSPNVGLRGDLYVHVLLLVEVVVVASTMKLLVHVDALIEQLPSGILGDTDEMFQSKEAIQEFISLRNPKSRLWYRTVLGFCVLLVYIFQVHIPVFSPPTYVDWARRPDLHPLSFTAGLLGAIWLYVVVLGNILWYCLSTAFSVFPFIRACLERKNLLIVPVAPDGKGGLAQVGNVAFKMNLIASAGMLPVLAWMKLNGIDRAFTIGFFVYLVFLTGIFFLPLMSIHKAMLKAKEEELTRFAGLFNDAYLQVRTSIGQVDETSARTIRDNVEYLAYLEQLYRRAEAMPVWPFNFKILGQFTTLILLPLILFLIQLVSQNALASFLKNLSN